MFLACRDGMWRGRFPLQSDHQRRQLKLAADMDAASRTPAMLQGLHPSPDIAAALHHPHPHLHPGRGRMGPPPALPSLRPPPPGPPPPAAQPAAPLPMLQPRPQPQPSR